VVPVCSMLGSVSACDTALGCGRFTQEFIDALKGLFDVAVCFGLLIVSVTSSKCC
jgi:hypothetical protein